MKLTKTIVFGALISFSCLATAEDQSSADAVKRAESQLGQIKSYNEIGGDWIWVEGSKDQFLMTKNGRFSLIVVDGALGVSDNWSMEQITFKDLPEARSKIPLEKIGFVPGGYREPKISFRFGNGQVLGTVFGVPSDKNSQEFMAQQDWSQADYSILYYPLPTEVNSWTDFFCAHQSLQRAVIIGESIEIPPASSHCDKQGAMLAASEMGSMAKLVDVKGVPFLVRHSDWKSSAGKLNLREYLK